MFRGGIRPGGGGSIPDLTAGAPAADAESSRQLFSQLEDAERDAWRCAEGERVARAKLASQLIRTQAHGE